MNQFFETFTARTIWTPELIVVLAVISVIYLALGRKYYHWFPDGTPVETRRIIYFHLGLLGIYLGFGGPLYVLGHIMLSMHMLSMAIVFLIAPPLLLIGIPAWFISFFAKFSIVRGFFKVAGYPIIGLILFNALFSFYHLPFTFDFLLTNEGMHNIYQIGMLLAAMLMWWHIIPRLVTRFNMSELKRIGYMFASGVLFTPACALIIFAGDAIYETYTNAAVWATAMAYCLPPGADIPFEVFSGEQSMTFLNNTYHDQQFGGAMMKIIQELAYGVAMGYTFRIWMKRDREETPKLELKEFDMYEPGVPKA